MSTEGTANTVEIPISSYQIFSETIVMNEHQDVVHINSVMRYGAGIVGTLAAFALLGFLLSGVIIIQPLVSLVLVIASIGFYLMSYAKPKSDALNASGD